jgi:hypothetical protein
MPEWVWMLCVDMELETKEEAFKLAEQMINDEVKKDCNILQIKIYRAEPDELRN